MDDWLTEVLTTKFNVPEVEARKAINEGWEEYRKELNFPKIQDINLGTRVPRGGHKFDDKINESLSEKTERLHSYLKEQIEDDIYNRVVELFAAIPNEHASIEEIKQAWEKIRKCANMSK